VDKLQGLWIDFVRERVCQKPDDKDKAGRRCGKRAKMGSQAKKPESLLSKRRKAAKEARGGMTKKAFDSHNKSKDELAKRRSMKNVKSLAVAKARKGDIEGALKQIDAGIKDAERMAAKGKMKINSTFKRIDDIAGEALKKYNPL